MSRDEGGVGAPVAREEPSDRQSLLGALHRASRQLTNQNGLYTDAAAARLGMNRTDLDCLSIVHLAGAVTAGELAETTGLSTGAITGVIDRLEKAGYVVREADPTDRRRVIVQAVPERGRAVGMLFDSMQQAVERLYERYTDDELAVLVDVNDRMLPIMQEETAKLRETTAAGGPDDAQPTEQSVPLGNIAGGRLEFVRGAANVVVRASTAPEQLYRARVERNGPVVTAHEGTVTVSYKRSSFRWSRTGTSELELSPAVPWTVAVRGGAARLRLDLRGLVLRQLDFTGGITNAEVILADPKGTVPVHVTGGAHNLTIHRPGAAPLAVRMRGGVSNLRLDDQRFGSIGGTMSWQTPEYENAADRYELTITGGASTFTVDTA